MKKKGPNHLDLLTQWDIWMENNGFEKCAEENSYMDDGYEAFFGMTREERKRKNRRSSIFNTLFFNNVYFSFDNDDFHWSQVECIGDFNTVWCVLSFYDLEILDQY